MSYTLYGTQDSYYTGKVRAYLRYKNIPFTEIPVDDTITKEILIPRTGSHFIPVVITSDDLAISDSTDIINVLEQRFPESPVLPSSPRQCLVAHLFELYGDEWFLLPAMHYRWHHNFDYTVKRWGREMAPELSEAEQWAIAKPQVEHFSGLCVPLGITETTIPAIEAWYEEFLGLFDTHLQQHDYLLGSRPCIGDYGLMGSLYAHLYQDPASGELMKRIAPNVAAWVERMNDPQVLGGEFLADDEIPVTLLPMLKHLFAEQFPVIADTVGQLADWLDLNPGEPIPRMLGSHKFKVHGVEGERAILTYVQWMWQHPLFFYQGLDGEDKAVVDDLLNEVGGYEAMQMQLRHVLTRKDGQLVNAM